MPRFEWGRGSRVHPRGVALVCAFALEALRTRAIRTLSSRRRPGRANARGPSPNWNTTRSSPPLRKISERIPAITGKRVLAASDRATIVFSGNRSLGETRLRARAAVMNGWWQEYPGVPTPTHVLFAPDSPAERYCGIELFPGRGIPTLPISSRTQSSDGSSRRGETHGHAAHFRPRLDGLTTTPKSFASTAVRDLSCGRDSSSGERPAYGRRAARRLPASSTSKPIAPPASRFRRPLRSHPISAMRSTS